MSLLLLGLVLGGCAPKVPVAAREVPAAPCCGGIVDGRLRQILEAGAATTDVPTRQRALAALVRADPAPGGGPWGGRVRYDPDEFVVQAGAAALAERVGDGGARDLLRAIALDVRRGGVTRGRAAAGALRLDPDHTWLASAWTPEATWWQLGGLWAVGARWDPAAAAALADTLTRGEVPLETGFWDLLAASGSPQLGAALAAARPRLEPELEVTAAVTLVALDPGAGSAAVGPLLHGDLDHALEVVERLHTLPGEAATALLRQGATSAPGAAARAAGLWMLLREDGPEGRLVDGLADTDPEVRRIAAEVAGGLQARGVALPARVRAALLTALEADDPGLQAVAVEAVAAGPDRSHLRPLLDDESLELRVRVAAALLRGGALGAG